MIQESITGPGQSPGIEIVREGDSIAEIQSPSLTTQSRELSLRPDNRFLNHFRYKMRFFKSLFRKYGPNPLDRLLRLASRKGQNRFLICWNRGLGDIALGLYALVYRIRQYVPDAEITFLTRSDLQEGFSLLEGVRIFVDPTWKRGVAFNLETSLQTLSLSQKEFDLILEHPDPTRWLMWQLGKLTPHLQWKEEWDLLCSQFSIDPNKPCIGAHVHTETRYAYEKNWPFDQWRTLFEKTTGEHGAQVLLFGFTPHPCFEMEGVIDLRGKTSLHQMLSLIKNRCHSLIVPDSGVLSLVYFLNCTFPLKVISLWADPRQGILKQNVSSPNRGLIHHPLIAPKGDLRTISAEQVLNVLYEGSLCSMS
jgi:ADP-heptose:LPS heptosyltransferase